MAYKFYHNSETKITTINKDYAWLKDQYHLYDLLLTSGWTVETCAPRLREKWSIANKTCGQCSITAFLVQDIFGGEVYGVQTVAGIHCFNKIGDLIFDLTSEQFTGNDIIKTYPLDLPQNREQQFASEEKYQRYLLLKEHLQNRKK